MQSPETKSPSASESQTRTSNVINQELKCGLCGTIFHQKSQLTLHKRNAHLSRSHHHRVRRLLGSQMFMLRGVRKLQVAVNGSKNGVKYQCLRCGKTFRLWSKFTFHWTYKHERKRRCLHCDVTLGSVLCLQEHMRKKHSQKITAGHAR